MVFLELLHLRGGQCIVSTSHHSNHSLILGEKIVYSRLPYAPICSNAATKIYSSHQTRFQRICNFIFLYCCKRKCARRSRSLFGAVQNALTLYLIPTPIDLPKQTITLATSAISPHPPACTIHTAQGTHPLSIQVHGRQGIEGDQIPAADHQGHQEQDGNQRQDDVNDHACLLPVRKVGREQIRIVAQFSLG